MYYNTQTITAYLFCILICAKVYYMTDSLMIVFLFVYLWSWYRSSELPWHALLAWYSTFTLQKLTEDSIHACRYFDSICVSNKLKMAYFVT